MAKLVVVKGNPVEGTDTHNVTGSIGNSPYTGTGDYKYHGSVTDKLSGLVTIAGTPVALVTSRSSLNPGEDTPAGAHGGPQGSNFNPAGTPSPVSIIDTPLGTGVPSSGAGSGVLTVNGVKVLLDGDKLDTCGPTPTKAASAVTAQGQDFVTCSV